MQRVNMDLPRDLWRRVGAAAALRGIQKREWVIEALQAKLMEEALNVEKINLETLIGTEYSPEIVDRYDWIDHYPVVSGGKIIAIYDAKNRDPEEYADYPIVDDAYIDADAEPEDDGY